MIIDNGFPRISGKEILHFRFGFFSYLFAMATRCYKLHAPRPSLLTAISAEEESPPWAKRLSG